LNIVVEDAKIFQTKERAPLLLCLEVFRPNEQELETPDELYDNPDIKEIMKEDEKRMPMPSRLKSKKTKGPKSANIPPT